MNNNKYKRVHSAVRGAVLIAGLAAASQLTTAAVTDLTNTPIATARTYVEPPNIMLLMDTSESMSWGHIPDGLETRTSEVTPTGYKSHQCNGVYFNPGLAYSLPKSQSGSGTLPEAVFTAAYVDYYRDAFGDATLTRDFDFFGNPARIVNLSAEFQAYTQITRQNKDQNAADTKQAAYYYTYTGSQLNAEGKLDPLGAACKTPDYGTASFTANGGGTWTRHIVSDADTPVPAQLSGTTNFARWYQYHRTRMSMMKSGMGLAFSTLPVAYRVGLLTMDPYAIQANASPTTDKMANPTLASRPARTTVDTKQYAALNAFNDVNRPTWYSKLYSQQPVGASPAREGLARVGRHYANETTEINAGMQAGAITAACQQNFTIMTTDGTWNTGGESANGGPLKLDRDFATGRWVGQQDGNLSDPLSGRPIYDGGRGGSRDTIDQFVTYGEEACSGGWYRKTNKQTIKTTVQVSQEIKQQFSRQERIWRSTFQREEQSVATLQTVRQVKETKRQMHERRFQALQSTVQDIRWTEQPQSRATQQQKRTLQTLADTKQIFQTDEQTKAKIWYWNKQTFQKLRTQVRKYQTVTQQLRTDRRWFQTTAQITETKTQVKKSTTQLARRITQTSISTTQLRRYDGATEQDFGVESCTPGGTVTCYTVETGPTLTASCSPQDKSSANGWKQTLCTTTSDTGWVGVETCSASGANSGNSFKKTECQTITTEPAFAASCVAANAGSGNSWTKTICDTTVVSGPTGVNSCAGGTTAAPNYVTTTCGNNNTGPTAVAACTAQGKLDTNQYTLTSCEDRVIVATYGVQTCTDGFETDGLTRRVCSSGNVARTNVDNCTAQTGNNGNGWKTIVCETDPVGAADQPVNTCTPSVASGLTTTCKDNNTNVAQTATCAASGKSSPNWIQTTCTEKVVSNKGVASCSNSAGYGPDGDATNYSTTCINANVAERAVSACTAKDPTSANEYLKVTCRTDTRTNVPVATCAVATGTTPNWIATTKCTANNSSWANGACTPVVASAGNDWTTTECQTIQTGGWTSVETCTPVTAGPGNGGNGNVCQMVTTPEVAVQTCTPVTGTAPNWVTVRCRQNTTTNVAVASCTPVAESSPNWIETTCSNANVDWHPVASCTAQTGNAGNSWVTIECDNRTTQAATFVQTCTPGTSASFEVTTCDTSANSTNVAVETCTPQSAAAPDWRAVTCSNPAATNYTWKAVATCTPQTATFANGWRTISCRDSVNTTPETLVASCTPNNGNSSPFIRTVCRTETVTAEAAVAYGTCTPVSPTSPDFVSTLCRTDNYPDAPVETCTPQAPNAGNSYKEVICTDRGVAPTAVVDGSCLGQNALAGNGWKQIICNTTSTTEPVMTQSCAATTGSAPEWRAVVCAPQPAHKITYTATRTQVSTILSGNAAVGTPTTTTQNFGPYYLDNVCYTPGAPSPAPVAPVVPDISVRAPVSLTPTPPTTCDGGTATWPCVITTAPAEGSDDLGSKNSLADVAQYYYVTDLRPDLGNKVASLGSGVEADTATWQHMTTFSIGLGVSGQLKYQKDYRSASSGDFFDLRRGRKADLSEANWPVWPARANTFSPAATLDAKGNYSDLRLYEDPRSIDDFWHAAVNGRGRYLSVDDPNSVITGLSEAFLAIQNTSGAGAGAATSALSPVSGDNMAYTATFTSREWTGDLQAYEISTSTNELSNTPRWSAKSLLNAQVGDQCDKRTIKYFKSTAVDQLADFTWETYACGDDMKPLGAATTGLTDTDLQALFTDETKLGELSQWPSLLAASSGADQRAYIKGKNLVNFIRGQRGYEGYLADADGQVDTDKPEEVAQAKRVFRKREAVLGDIVNSQPAYVKGPTQNYQDADYQTFRTLNKDRKSMIYVGANDGMLHAFYAPGVADETVQGKEAWAYVPRAVMKNLYRLADNEYEYENKHRFFVDGSPISGDIYDGVAKTWKTILVGGLNKGGKGYYALDVTNPDAPKGLWEFNLSATCFNPSNPSTGGSDCALGYTFGKPVITKLANGTWVVLVTSGFNNVPSEGDGAPDVGTGYLYVIDANTGKLIHKIATGAGSAGSPSNLRDINTYVANLALDNTAMRVYGGDMMGNVWRFNINNLDGDGNPAPSVTLLGKTLSSDNKVQPVTTNVELAEINGNTMVFVGTGRLVNVADLDDKAVQSVFAFKDPLTQPALPDAAFVADGNMRAVLKPLRMVEKVFKVKPGTREPVLNETDPFVELTSRVVECTGDEDTICTTVGGWVLDLPDSGERVNVDMRIALNTLAFTTNVPQTEICSSGGYSWLNYLDLYTGNPVSTSPGGMVSTRLNVITVGLGLLVSSDGRTSGLITGSDGGKPKPYDIPTGTPGPVGRRISWREVVQ